MYKKKEFIAAWNLNYHEVLSISNYYREVTNVRPENDELQTHYDYNSTTIEQSEREVDIIIQFITSHGNPFEKGEQQLRNIVTQELVNSDSIEALLNIFRDSCELYKHFYDERFVNKLKSLSDRISNVNFPNFKTSKHTQSNIDNRVSNKKKDKIAHKIIEIIYYSMMMVH